MWIVWTYFFPSIVFVVEEAPRYFIGRLTSELAASNSRTLHFGYSFHEACRFAQPQAHLGVAKLTTGAGRGVGGRREAPLSRLPGMISRCWRAAEGGGTGKLPVVVFPAPLPLFLLPSSPPTLLLCHLPTHFLEEMPQSSELCGNVMDEVWR